LVITYSLIGSNGDTITFDNSNYVLNPDFVGFGIPPAQVRIEPSAGDGGVFRHSKRGVREIDMSVTILGADHEDVQTKLRRLSRLIQDTSGPTQIVAEYEDGETLTLEAHYVGGAESQWGSNAGLTWNRWALSFHCPNPYWQSETVEDFTVTTGNTGRGLLPQLSKLKVTSSQVFGVITIDNQGDVPAYPIWYFRGPLSDLTVSNGTQSFGFSVAIEEGETITVNTETGEVFDDGNNNRYSDLLPAPKLFRIPPGVSSISVNGVAASSQAQARLEFAPLYEVVH
jgi:phage-related protein